MTLISCDLRICSVPFGGLHLSWSQRTKTSRSRQPERTGRRPPASRNKPKPHNTNRCYTDEVLKVKMGPVTGPQTIPVIPENQPVPIGLIRFKKSERWYAPATRCVNNGWWNVPYIDKSGQIFATSVSKWQTTAPKLLATIISTVYKRLWGRNRQISPKKRISSDTLYRVAAIYSITNDDSFYRRCVSMLAKARGTELRKFVFYHQHKMDENKRFLFDQVRFASLWLQCRWDRCPLRESPNDCKKLRPSICPKLGKMDVRRFVVEVRSWATVYGGPEARPNFFCSCSTVAGKELQLFRGKSMHRAATRKSGS